MGTAYATKLLKTRQGSKSPLRLQMTCSQIRKKLYLSKVVKSPNHRLVRMAAGSDSSGQYGGKHQVVRHIQIIEFSAATVQPHVRKPKNHCMNPSKFVS